MYIHQLVVKMETYYCKFVAHVYKPNGLIGCILDRITD